MPILLMDLLKRMVRVGASDLHLKAGARPGLRIEGRVKAQTDLEVLKPEDTARFAKELLTRSQQQMFSECGDLDCSLAVGGLARFRINVLTQRGSIGLVLRVIPDKIPSVAQLGLPRACTDLAMRPRGLVLVTGPTGCGKSTTLAAMVNHINANLEGHILTMEDPLEFIHPDKKSYVTQRQIGSDCKSFAQALRRGLRQDPDVILIGEMRDLETIDLALTAAETGHLVLGSLHTTGAISTIDRIIDVFPPGAQEQVRVKLANTLLGVISQCLVRRIGGGQVAATEVLLCTDGVRSLIREGKTSQILSFLQTGAKLGMHTLEHDLAELVNSKTISGQEAVAKANRPQEVIRAANVPIEAPPEVAGDFGTEESYVAMVDTDSMLHQPASQVPYQGFGTPTGPQGSGAVPARPEPLPGGNRRRKGGLFDRRPGNSGSSG